MKRKWPQEPWRRFVEQKDESNVCSSSGEIICVVQDAATAERIVACVNGCKNIGDPSAVSSMLAALMNIANLHEAIAGASVIAYARRAAALAQSFSCVDCAHNWPLGNVQGQRGYCYMWRFKPELVPCGHFRDLERKGR